MDDLTELLSESPRDIRAIARWFDRVVDSAAKEVNRVFAVRRLAKGTRDAEPLPTDTRQLSSYRTRIGTMLEYAISTEVDKIIWAEAGDDYYFTFAVAHEYPDFYFRDDALARLLRIEMKAVDAESDEQAARFGVPTVHIEPENDLLLFVGWEWTPIHADGVEVGEYPHIFATLVVSADDLVKERDTRQLLLGGKIEGDKAYVKKRGKKDEFSLDPDNYGKLWRLIHGSRLERDDLSPGVQRFLNFLRTVDEHSPRNRFGS